VLVNSLRGFDYVVQPALRQSARPYVPQAAMHIASPPPPPGSSSTSQVTAVGAARPRSVEPVPVYEPPSELQEQWEESEAQQQQGERQGLHEPQQQEEEGLEEDDDVNRNNDDVDSGRGGIENFQ
jgi:hypothetical protein